MIDSDDPLANSTEPSVESAAESRFDVVDFLLVIAKHKKLVFGVPLAAAIMSGGVTLLWPNIYTATARILPPQQSQSLAGALLGQFASISGAAATSFGMKNPSDLYVAMLKSRSVADSVIAKFQLDQLYRTDTSEDTRTALADVTAITPSRDGIITISVDDTDPARAAAIANAYVEYVDQINDRLAVTEAAQRRLFFERQLERQKEALASAEVALKRTQEQTGLIKLDEQGRALIEAVATLRAQIAAKEVQLSAMGEFSTKQNPEHIRAQAELKGLRQQLNKLEQSSVQVTGQTFVPAGNVPEAGLEYVRRLREVKYQESLFELLAKQYEIARLEESKDASLIQVLDRAVAPEKKSKPRRTQIVVSFAIAAAFLALLLAFAIESLDRIRSHPTGKQRIRQLKSYFLKF